MSAFDAVPKYCPLCGASVDVVRHIAANAYEMMCEQCGRPNVVLVDDHEKIH